MAQDGAQPAGWSRVALAAGGLGVVGACWALGLGDAVTFERLQQERETLAAAAALHPIGAPAAFFGAYVLTAALSLPWATPLSLLGGFLFGTAGGVALVSAASTLGATLALLLSRTLLRDAAVRLLGDRMAPIDAGIRRDGAFYLFTLRLVPAVPFFALNAAAGLTPMPVWTYTWVSLLGMLPATVVLVNLGTRLAEIESAADLLSAPVAASFVALGLLPLAARFFTQALRKRRAGATSPLEETPAGSAEAESAT